LFLKGLDEEPFKNYLYYVTVKAIDISLLGIFVVMCECFIWDLHQFTLDWTESGCVACSWNVHV